MKKTRNIKRIVSGLMSLILLFTFFPVDGIYQAVQAAEVTTLQGSWQKLDGGSAETCAVLTGKLKKNEAFQNPTNWPLIGVKITDRTNGWEDAFQMVYYYNGYGIKTPSADNYSKNTEQFDCVYVAQESILGNRTSNPLNVIFEGGLWFKIIRLDNWAYFLIKTGESYEIVHRMVLPETSKSTTFALRTENVDAATEPVTLNECSIAYGRDAALKELEGSSFAWEETPTKVAEAVDSLYVPVDSTEWTLEAKVVLSDYESMNGDTTQDGRGIHVGPGDGENTYASWQQGLGICNDTTGTWVMQTLNVWNINHPSMNLEHVAKMAPSQEGMWIRYVRSGNQLIAYTSTDRTDWTEVASRADLSLNAKGLYIDTGSRTVLTELSLCASSQGSFIQSNGTYNSICGSVSETYAALSGTLKITGAMPTESDNNVWPNIDLQVIANEGRMWDSFQLLYAKHNNAVGIKVFNVPETELGSNGKPTDENITSRTYDNVLLSRTQRIGASDTLLEKIFGDGLDFKVVRLGKWAYFLAADDGGVYEILARMCVSEHAPTNFGVYCEGFTADNRIELSGTSLVTGKEAALQVLTGSRFTWEQDDIQNGASECDSLYLPVGSANWMLEAKVTLPNYKSMNGDTSKDGRGIHAGPGDGTKSTYYAWWKGLGVCNDTTGAWVMQELEDFKRNLPMDATHAEQMNPDQGGMWIRYVRSGTELVVYTSADGMNWKFVNSRTNLGTDAQGIYIDTGAAMVLSDMTLSLQGKLIQSNGVYNSLYGLQNDTYAALSGTLKITGDMPTTMWPNINFQVTAGSNRFENAFQLLYAEHNGYLGIKAMNVPDVTDEASRTYDHVVLSQQQSMNTKKDLLKQIFQEGLDFKVVRLGKWAYFLAADGEGVYEILARMCVKDEYAPTEFGLYSTDFAADNRIELSGTSLVTGKEAALQVLAGSQFTWEKEDIRDAASERDSLYLPVDSAEWTLEAKVTLSEYASLNASSDGRALHVGSGDERATEWNAWNFGLGFCHTSSGKWEVQKLNNWLAPQAVDSSHAAKMAPAQGGMWIQYVRRGSTLSVSTSADGKNWTKVNSRTDLGTDAEGLYIDTAAATTLSDLRITVDKGMPKGVTVSIGDSIDVNFYMELYDSTLKDDGAYVEFTIPKRAESIKKVPVKDIKAAGTRTYNGVSYYVCSCNIAAKEMASDIKLRIVGSDDVAGTWHTYQVKTYGDRILADTQGLYSDSAKTLVKAMLNYGAYAQVYFVHGTTPANAGLTAAEKQLKEVSISDTYKQKLQDDLVYMEWYGSSLMTTSKTSLRHYFKLDKGKSISDYTFVCNGKTLEPVQKGAYYYVEISGISADMLGSMYELKVTGEDANRKIILNYGPYTNIKAILQGDYPEATKDMMKALYWYGIAAAEYAGKEGLELTYSLTDQSLYYTNSIKINDLADPFVLDNTKQDGYYYIYGTGLTCHRSVNLMDWEQVPDSNILQSIRNSAANVVYKDVWAPEVVYDSDTKLYYLFFSATPYVAENTRGAKCQMFVAVSSHPYKDFRLVNFTDASSCGEENRRTTSSYPYNAYYADYTLLESKWYSEFSKDIEYAVKEENANYAGAIDPHPYVDEDGQKYLYWVDNVGKNVICVVKMINWLKPDLNSAVMLTYAGYYTINDWKNNSSNKVSYEKEDNNGETWINEGPAVVRHRGKYYLTFSVNGYNTTDYQVAQAVADSPTGPFRKLTEAEGALLLSGWSQGGRAVSGPGHHSFVTVGDRMYIIYHRHNDSANTEGARNPAIDELRWINVGNLDVMYVNGPTLTMQPSLEGFGRYCNIAGEARITGVKDAAPLTDGLLSISKGNAVFQKYIPELALKGTTTLQFDFDSLRTVKGLMIYNSKDQSTMMKTLSSIRLVCESEGRQVIRYGKNLAFDTNCIPGAALCVTFPEELHVMSIELTVDVPAGEQVGISEICILGK